MFFCFVFFFKQKTAYEMRISDWSSDVCSSDLDVVRLRRIEEGKESGVTHVAAVPVGHAVDLDRLKDQRQAGRGHHHVGGQLVALEDLHAAGLHVGGGDVDLQMRAGAHLLEVDHRLQQVPQRIEVQDRKSGVEGKGVYVRVDIGGGR